MRELIVKLLLASAFLGAISTSASAHVVPWRAGESRMLGFGHCAKGPCMKRVSWSKARPHTHVQGKVVFDRYITPSSRRDWTLF